MVRVNKWIQEAAAHSKKGALHRQLGYKQDEKIPTGTLRKIVATDIGNKVPVKGRSRRVTTVLKRRANFALNVRK